MTEDKATTETPCCRMVDCENGWGVWEEGRAWLCVGPDVGAAQSVHTAELVGFSQSMNIYWFLLCARRGTGGSKGICRHSVYWKRQDPLDRSRTEGQSRPPEHCAGQISSHTLGILEDSVPGLSFLLGC